MNQSVPQIGTVLKKELGLFHVFCIATGTMISSGIFVLPGLAHAKAGPAVVVSYFLAGLLAAVGMLNVAEMSTAMPRAGGDYFFVTRSMGPAVGTIAGLLTWFSLTLKSSFALIGMGVFARILINPNMSTVLMQWTAFVFCLMFIGLNIIGAREAAQLQGWLVCLLLALIGLYIVFGLPAIRAEYFDPVAPHGWPPVLFTAGFVFVAYGGLLKVSSIAEEVRNPGRVIPLAMGLSLFVTLTCYTLMVLVTIGVFPGNTLDGSLTPISDGAAVFMGKWGVLLMGIAAILAFITTANGGILAASRYLLALSRDNLIPVFLKNINLRFQTPHNAVILTGVLAATALFLDLNILVEGASTVLILSYMLSCLSIIVLRESRLQNYRPQFRAPLYPWLQILGIAGFSLLIFEMGIEAFIASLMLILSGFLTYWFYGRSRTLCEYALLHLIERITAKEFVTGTLESELKQIIRERDTIVLDRFDLLVEQCPVLDLTEPLQREDVFERVASAMANRVGMTPEDFLKLLTAREKESSTVLSSCLAIPHIVVERDAPVEMLIIRCKHGIRFNEKTPGVRAVIVLAGPSKDRNFHLRCLTAIAQIVQSPDFESRWLAAKGEQALRDIFLLGERRREES